MQKPALPINKCLTKSVVVLFLGPASPVYFTSLRRTLVLFVIVQLTVLLCKWLVANVEQVVEIMQPTHKQKNRHKTRN
jgi:hypothetical protein